MTPARRSRAASFALALASVAASLALAELGLRLFYPVGRLTYRISPELLFELAPDTSRAFLHHPADGGGFVVSHVNSRGFRGPELREAPARRVVVYGDSFVQAEYSPFEETFPHQLELALGDGVEVVNAGVRAYGPDQALLHLERTRAELDPDAIVFAVYAGNDFGDLVRNKLFRSDGDAGVRRSHPRLDPPLVAEFEQHPLERLALAGLYRVAKRGLKLRRKPGVDAQRFDPERLLALCRAELASQRADDVARKDVFEDHYDADLALEPGGEGAAEKQRLMRGVLARLAGSRGGVALRVVVIPAALDVAPGLGGLAIPRERWPDYDPRRLSRSAVLAAQAAGLSVIDLWDAFAPEADSLYYPSNRHWNARGQALAARVVADALR